MKKVFISVCFGKFRETKFDNMQDAIRFVTHYQISNVRLILKINNTEDEEWVSTTEDWNNLDAVIQIPNDIYDNLDSYFINRIEIIEMLSKIDERIDWVLGYFDTRNLSYDKALKYLVNKVIYYLVCDTRMFCSFWDDDKLDEYDDLMTDRITNKYGEYINGKIIPREFNFRSLENTRLYPI